MWFAVGLVVVLVAWNNVANLFAGYAQWYVPLTLALAAVIAALARVAGLTWRELGLSRDGVGRGFAWGAAVAAAAFVVLGLAVAVPSTRPLLADARVEGLGAAGIAFWVLVRIPFGTALLEEFAFRGALLAAWARRLGQRRAQLVQATLFGVWHITPTWVALEVNELVPGSAQRAAVIAAAVVVTAIGGWLFGWLRLRAESLLAPLVAHWGLNAAATLAGAAALTFGGAAAGP